MISQNDSVQFQAVVDQDFAKVNDPKKVDPTEFSGRHQLHLTRLRVLDQYEVEHAGRKLSGGRTITSELNLSKTSIMILN